MTTHDAEDYYRRHPKTSDTTIVSRTDDRYRWMRCETLERTLESYSGRAGYVPVTMSFSRGCRGLEPLSSPVFTRKGRLRSGKFAEAFLTVTRASSTFGDSSEGTVPFKSAGRWRTFRVRWLR